jgi:hypothetical protein
VVVLAAASSAWRTRRVRSGPLAAVMTLVVGSTLSTAFGIALFFGVIRHDPVKLRMFEITGGWGETWGLPVLLLPVAMVLGTFGGMLGRLARAARPHDGVRMTAPH